MKFMEILVSQGRSQGGSSSAGSIDLTHFGVAPSLIVDFELDLFNKHT